MKKLFLLISYLFFIGICIALCTSPAYARKGGIPQCVAELEQAQADLNMCNADLDTCNTDLGTCSTELGGCEDDLAACEAEDAQVFPGDGYASPDAFGVSGHGPALSYTDNGDGTFTDNNTGFMWEIKDDGGGVHDKDNRYIWSATLPNPDGTLFTVFLDTLNNKCDGDETTTCTSNADCTGIGNELCGHAGYRDWSIPNVKELQSIIDYSKSNPPSSVPGLTGTDFVDSYGPGYWSATTLVGNPNAAWAVGLLSGLPGGEISGFGKEDVNFHGRAVRP